MSAALAIVGAGPKAAAITARAATWATVASQVPPGLLIFEQDHVGSAWSGKGAYSSGFLELCTPGEKDVGYPYADVPTRRVHRSPSLELFARFSWPAFLIAHAEYADWVDRGRQYPKHRRYADYLDWVFRSAKQDVVPARVDRIVPEGGAWTIHSIEAGKRRTDTVDGVVLTGAGTARTVPITGAPPPASRLLTAESFWSERDDILSMSEGTVAVAGDGGAAGTIVAWLSEALDELDVKILSISPLGTLFVRGDGFAERRWFSDPGEWLKLSREHRLQILDRTEAGVVSHRLKAAIDQAGNVGYVPGRVTAARWTGSEFEVVVSYGASTRLVQADFLVSAIGFDRWSLLDLVDHPRIRTIRAEGAGAALRTRIEDEMLEDLSLPPSSGLPAGLHLPGLAALRHGPGLGSLNSLGLMATAILDRYLK